MYNIKKRQAGFVHLVVLIPIVAIAIVAIIGMVVVRANNSPKQLVEGQVGGSAEVSEQRLADIETQDTIATEQQEKQAEPSLTDTKTKPSVSAPTEAPKKPTVALQSCLPSNANEYDKYHINETNSQYIKNGSYVGTSKFYDALVFAGLKETVDKPKVVVFAMADGVFDKLSQAQLDYMYASPANMKSVIGWHVVQSCVVWKNNIAIKTSEYSFNTLNGKVTHSPGSPGKVNDATMAIWDWYTSNGAVHIITDFIKAPTL